MWANDSKSYLSYLNKLVDECNNSDYCPICKTIIDADCFALSKVNKLSRKTHKFKRWFYEKTLYRKLIRGHTKLKI